MEVTFQNIKMLKAKKNWAGRHTPVPGTWMLKQKGVNSKASLGYSENKQGKGTRERMEAEQNHKRQELIVSVRLFY